MTDVELATVTPARRPVSGKLGFILRHCMAVHADEPGGAEKPSGHAMQLAREPAPTLGEYVFCGHREQVSDVEPGSA